MQYVYVVAYLLRGLHHPKDQGDSTLYEKETVSATLTGSYNDHLKLPDRGTAVRTLLLKALFGQPAADLSAALDQEAASYAAARSKDLADGEVLVIRFTGDAQVPVEKIQTKGDLSVGFDLIDKDATRRKHTPEINAIVTAATLLPAVEAVEKVADDIHLIDDKGNPVIPIVASGSAKVSVSHGTKGEEVAFLQQRCNEVLKDKSLEKVHRLIAPAQRAGDDRFRVFTSAWTALEIFVNKTFKKYGDQFVNGLRGDAPAVPNQLYWKRITEVMKDKYRLMDKFTMMAAALGVNGADEDIKTFKQIKDVRDELLHGEDVDEQGLPVEKVMDLLRKHLAEHLKQYSK